MTYDRELRTEAAHALTHNQEVWSDRGYAVVTAGGLSEGDTDFELDVGPYDVLVGSTDTVSVGPTTLSVNAPDNDPYWLVVYVDSDGLQTEQGPEGEVFVGDQSVVASNADVREITSPAPPTLAGIGPVTILGKVLVTSSGVSNSLIDGRTFGGGRIADSLAFRSLDGQIDTTNLSDEAVTAAKIAASAVESGKIASGAVGVDELAEALGTSDSDRIGGTTHMEAASVDEITVNGNTFKKIDSHEQTGGDVYTQDVVVDFPIPNETKYGFNMDVVMGDQDTGSFEETVIYLDNDDDTGRYVYYDETATRQASADTIPLADLTGSNLLATGWIWFNRTAPDGFNRPSFYNECGFGPDGRLSGFFTRANINNNEDGGGNVTFEFERLRDGSTIELWEAL